VGDGGDKEGYQDHIALYFFSASCGHGDTEDGNKEAEAVMTGKDDVLRYMLRNQPCGDEAPEHTADLPLRQWIMLGRCDICGGLMFMRRSTKVRHKACGAKERKRRWRKRNVRTDG